VLQAIAGARGKGIRFYPIAASGADTLAEHTMRTLAQVTGGRFIFLTDDSGVGNSHLEPTIPCYHVTRLDQAMTRVIAIEVSGSHIPVDPDHVIRTGGDPEDGRCSLEGGREVLVY
ncbi:MAG: VWA domain-containing protein, partial [Myxococcota bacterium]